MREAKWWERRTRRRLGAAAAMAVLLAGCGPDLGECRNPPNPMVDTEPYPGQVLVNNSCAGSRCHGAAAAGDAREGAPAELNFDVVPRDESAVEIAKIREGSEQVNDHIESMWAEIEEGSMPPSPPAGTPLTAEQKETIRDWLACGAPVVPKPSKGGPIGDDWTSIYESFVSATSDTMCRNCHGANNSAAGGGFILGEAGDACAAYARVFNKPAVTTNGTTNGMPTPCAPGNRLLVVPNNPDASLLLQKVEGTQDCGQPMPFGDALGPNHSTVQSLRRWIMAGALKPAGCP